MTEIASNIISLKQQIPGSVKIVAVSKTKPDEDILQAYNTGQRIFGENRVHEIVSKKDNLPGDIEWHFIGHLQTNKVKSIAPFINMIESIDSFRLLKVIENEAIRCGRIINCLLQFYIAREETKSGFSLAEAKEMLESDEFRSLNNIRLCGVMGMATYTYDTAQVRNEFRTLHDYFTELQNKYFIDNPAFKEISMGMSGDFRIAIEEGSTMVRIGSIIFGERK